MQRLFGKELLVLLWAVELPDVKPEEIAVAIRNWLGLKPEERWWLYTMTAAATGLAHQVGMGWRGALRQALCFGTRSDAFHLGAVTGRGTLEPRVNARFAAVEEEGRAKEGRRSRLPVRSARCRPNDGDCMSRRRRRRDDYPASRRSR